MGTRGDLEACIVGAGVVGLTTALLIQNEFPNINLSIVANLFNQKTTSDGAAGLFYPSSSYSGPNLEITKKWMLDSYLYYDGLRLSSEGDRSGVFPLSGYKFSRYSPKAVRNHYMEEVAPVYRNVSEEELNLYPGNWKYGTFCETLGIECRQYLPWALSRFKENGGKILSRKIESFDELANDFDLVMNCSGLGSQQLCQDHQLVPIRGQVIKVHAPWLKQFVFGEGETYIIPSGRGRVTLGGCRQYENYSLEVSPRDTDTIRELTHFMIPRLANAPELEIWVGLRPHRQPVRVEAEMLNIPSRGGGALKVVHNYGHGGYGVTTAPGTAKYAVGLFRQLHSASRGSQHSKL